MKNTEISNFLQSRIDTKDFPSAVYLVAESGKIVFQDALGFAVVEPEKIEARIDTIYDLASLTKVLVTGLLCTKLIETGKITLQDRISTHFTEFDTNEKRQITIENLLTHTSGFKAWLPFYLLENKRQKPARKQGREPHLNEEDSGKNLKASVLENIASEPRTNATNQKVVYSDLNFILLRYLIEMIHSKPFEEIAKKEIIEPLELKDIFFNPSNKLLRRIAASEKGNRFERQTCIEQGDLKPSATSDGSDFFRHYQIWGEVHDGNCFFMNGVSGHAGLFSTAEETFKIAQQFLPNQTKLLKPETCKLFRTNYTKGMNEARSIAFQLAETPESTASNALAKDSFGHLGFTGTSLWIEPDTERIFILLTNRTHARELPFENINSVRRRFHELATEDLDKM